MLFPAVHRLGFQVGHAVSTFLYSTASTLDQNNVSAKTILECLTDTQLLLDTLKVAIRHILRFPGLYRKWWWNLVTKDPLHVAVETLLLLSMVYMMLSRSTEGYKDSSKDKLSLREQEDLLWEWKHKTRTPLAPKLPKSESTKDYKSNQHVPMDDDFQIVVQKQEGKWLTVTVPQHWVSDENTNSNGTSSKRPLTENNNTTNRNNGSNGKNANGRNKNAKSQSKKKKSSASSNNTPRQETELTVLNFCNFDFLGLQTCDKLRQVSVEALEKYGCGSCGPRGFYGTIDAHLQLEEHMAQFCRTDQAILYSDGASTCSSTVAAFAKRGDVLVVDEGVYEPISTGVTLSRANVHYFQHNDMQDLERVLKELQATDKKLGRKPGAQRRFIVVEGLYKNMGTIAPLDKIIALKHKYKYRLILDESHSFGTLGKTGRGALEEFGKRPMYDSEITTIALENALGSIGGVTVGTEEVVDHQRLSGAGYCFSASAPPFTASAATASIQILEERPDLVQTLQSNVQYTHQQLLKKVEDLNQGTQFCYKFVVTSDPKSPIVVLQLEYESQYESKIMSEIMRHCLKRGIGIVASTAPEQGFGGGASTELAPCIRMTVSALHTKEDTDKAIEVLIESASSVTNKYPEVPIIPPTP